MRAFVPMQISSKVFQFAIALGLVSSTAATASAQFQRSGPRQSAVHTVQRSCRPSNTTRLS